MLELISEFIKAIGIEINEQKSVAFLYTKNEPPERKIKKIILFPIGSKTIKIGETLEDGLIRETLEEMGVDPDYRKQGFARKMVAFVKEYAQRDPAYCGMALYTEKPWAYYSSGFTVYEPELPPEESISSNGTESGWISLAGRNREDPLRSTVLSIYENAPSFPGKCIRSSKTWEEIFEEEKHLFRIQEQSFILRKEGRILEAYSLEKSYCDSGSFEEHILMTLPFREEDLFARMIREKRFLFPVADTF